MDCLFAATTVQWLMLGTLNTPGLDLNYNASQQPAYASQCTAYLLVALLEHLAPGAEEARSAEIGKQWVVVANGWDARELCPCGATVSGHGERNNRGRRTL
jgi:hypothetical protein